MQHTDLMNTQIRVFLKEWLIDAILSVGSLAPIGKPPLTIHGKRAEGHTKINTPEL